MNVLERLLNESQYPREKTEFLVRGFKEGFTLGYQGPCRRNDTSENIPLSVGTKTDLWNHIMKEVKERRFAGPFKRLPFKYYVQSPIGLVRKGIDKTRLIFHLFYDFPKSGLKSVNFYTPEHLCSVKYNDLDFAIKTCLTLNTIDKPLWFSKTDVKSAFYLVPLARKF